MSHSVPGRAKWMGFLNPFSIKNAPSVVAEGAMLTRDVLLFSHNNSFYGPVAILRSRDEQIDPRTERRKIEVLIARSAASLARVLDLLSQQIAHGEVGL